MPERAKAARLQSIYSDWSVAEQLALVEAVQRQEILLCELIGSCRFDLLFLWLIEVLLCPRIRYGTANMPDFVGIGKAVRAAMSYPGAKVQMPTQINLLVHHQTH